MRSGETLRWSRREWLWLRQGPDTISSCKWTANNASIDGSSAAIAQLGERQTEDLKVPGSIPELGIFEAPQNAVS